MVKVFQWGRKSASIFGQPDCEGGLGVALVSGIIYRPLPPYSNDKEPGRVLLMANWPGRHADNFVSMGSC